MESSCEGVNDPSHSIKLWDIVECLHNNLPLNSAQLHGVTNLVTP
jgi:hypothetical protein